MSLTQQIKLLADEQVLTANWKCLGPELITQYKKTFGIYLDLDVNDSENVQIRALAKYEEGGDGYPFPIKAVQTSKVTMQDEYLEFASDADQKLILSFSLDKIVPIIQIQIKAGTVGASPGKVTARSTVGGY